MLLYLKEQVAVIFMATHDLVLAKETGTRIGIMREGAVNGAQRSKQRVAETAALVAAEHELVGVVRKQAGA